MRVTFLDKTINKTYTVDITDHGEYYTCSVPEGCERTNELIVIDYKGNEPKEVYFNDEL